MLYRLTRWACSTPPGTMIDDEAWPAPAYYGRGTERVDMLAAFIADGTLVRYDATKENSEWYRHFGLLAEAQG